MRAFGQGSPMRLHCISCLRGHRLLLLLRTGEPVFSFRRNRAPAALLVNPIGGQDIQELFPMPQREHVHVLPDRPAGNTIEGRLRVRALEAGDQEPVLSPLDVGSCERTLREGIDERAGGAPLPLVFPLWINASIQPGDVSIARQAASGVRITPISPFCTS